MKQYISYTKYLIKHKWYVFLAGMKYFPSISMFYRLIVHDLSKFTPLEFITYANTFYKKDGSSQYNETEKFNFAWNHHQHKNKHHYQYWQLKMDRGDIVNLTIPYIYVKEMIADWIGAGKSIHNDWYNVLTWYESKDKSVFDFKTKLRIELYLDKIKKDKDCNDERIRILGY